MIPESVYESDSAPMSDDMETRCASGDIFGKYRVGELIGVGGMAEVYQAEHIGLRKQVALKVLSQHAAALPGARERFMREGERASMIRHPNVVDITDVGEVRGVPYLVMELLRGEDLRQHLLRIGPASEERIATILLPVLAAVSAGHLSGVIHRDLKPDNIFLTRHVGNKLMPKVLDFGVSRILDDDDDIRLTAANAVLGTPAYMAPEQARGEEVDERADQYALGIIAYEAVTGELPRTATSVLKMLSQASQGYITPIEEYRSDLSQGFRDVLQRALAVEPNDRFPNILSFARALTSYATPAARGFWKGEFAEVSEHARLIDTSFGASTDKLEIASSGMNLEHEETPTIIQPLGQALSPIPPSGQALSPIPPSGQALSPIPPLGQALSPANREALQRLSEKPPQPTRDQGVQSEAQTSEAEQRIALVSSAPPLALRSAVASQNLTMPSLTGATATRRKLAGYGALALAAAACVVLVINGSQGEGPSHQQEVRISETSPIASYDVLITCAPADAKLELDGQNVGYGAYRANLAMAEQPRQLVVSRAGYLSRTITLHNAPIVRHVELILEELPADVRANAVAPLPSSIGSSAPKTPLPNATQAATKPRGKQPSPRRVIATTGAATSKSPPPRAKSSSAQPAPVPPSSGSAPRAKPVHPSVDLKDPWPR